MLTNLSNELQHKNVTQRAVAKMLGLSEKSMVNKMNGTSEFTIGEALMIRREILPEFTFDYLFTDDRSA